MPTVADQLHEAREARKLTIEQVAEVTKIRSDHVRALEEGNFNVFSAPVYIRGFVRTYSTLLKLDVPRIMATLDGELGQTKKFAEPPPLSDHPRGALDFLMLQLSRIDWRRGVLILGVAVVVLALVLGYVGYRHYRTNDPLKNVKPGVYKAPQKNGADALPLPPARK